MKFLNGQLQLDSSLTGTTALFTSGMTINGLTLLKGSGTTSGTTAILIQSSTGGTGSVISNTGNYGINVDIPLANFHSRGLYNELYFQSPTTNSGRHDISFGFGSTGRQVRLIASAAGSSGQGNLYIASAGGDAGVATTSNANALFQTGGNTFYKTFSLDQSTLTSGNGLYIAGNQQNAITNGIYFRYSETRVAILSKPTGGGGNADFRIATVPTIGGSGNNPPQESDTKFMITHDTANTLINTTTDLGFKLSVSGSTLLRGSGTTSASYALATQNSSGGTTMVVNNAGNMLIGTTTDAGYRLDVNGTARLNSTTLIEGPLTVNYGGVNGGTSIVANGNTAHNSGRGIYTTGYAYGIQANHTMVGNWSDQPNAAGVHGTGQIGVFGSGDIAGFSGPSAFFTVLNGNSRVSARSHISTFQIRGSGSTELTNTLLLENSSGIKTFTVNDNGNVLIGLSGSTGQKLQVSGTSLFMGVIPFSANNQTIAMVDIQPNFNRSSFTGTTALALRVSGGTQIIGSGSTGTTLSVFSVDGSSGRLFDVSDDLSSTLFSVNTIAGLPVIEAFANNAVVMGKYNQNTLVVSGTSVGIGTNATNGKLIVKGSGTTSGSTTVLIQNSATTTSLIINDAGNVGIGTSSPQAKLDVNGTMLLGSLSGDPSGANGMIYYNTTTNKFRGYENGAWGNLIG